MSYTLNLVVWKALFHYGGLLQYIPSFAERLASWLSMQGREVLIFHFLMQHPPSDILPLKSFISFPCRHKTPWSGEMGMIRNRVSWRFRWYSFWAVHTNGLRSICANMPSTTKCQKGTEFHVIWHLCLTEEQWKFNTDTLIQRITSIYRTILTEAEKQIGTLQSSDNNSLKQFECFNHLLCALSLVKYIKNKWQPWLSLWKISALKCTKY